MDAVAVSNTLVDGSPSWDIAQLTLLPFRSLSS